MEQRTRKYIRDTFVLMLEEESLDKITVKGLVSRCGINRNTFYYYYRDIYALLDDLLQQELEDAIRKTNHSYASWQEGFLDAITFALEHRQAVYHAYNSRAKEYVIQFLLQVAGHILTGFIQNEAFGLPENVQDQKILVDFYKHALTGVVTDWLRGNMQENLSAKILRLGILMEGSIRRNLKNGLPYSDTSTLG